MHLSELLTRELDVLRERSGRDTLYILETGSIRNEAEQYHQNDGWSTLTFAEYVSRYEGAVVSVDLDTRAADVVLRRHGLRDRVDLIQEHSIAALAALVADPAQHESFDVILLDSDNDDDLILHEYLLASYLLAPGGLLLVDDVEPGSDLVVKGRKLLPWLDKAGVTYRLETRTGADLSTGVLVMTS